MSIFAGGIKSCRTRSFWVFAMLIGLSLILAACGDELTEEEAQSLAGSGRLASPNPANTTVLILTDEATAIANASAFLSPFDFPVVDSMDTSVVTPTLGDLLNYDAVLFSSLAGETDRIATGDAVADYIDAGGGVVITTPSHLLAGGAWGRIYSSGQSPFKFDASGNVGPDTLNTVYQPGHYIMTNVTAVSASARDDPTLAVGGTLLADWTDGTLTVAINSAGTVAGITIYLPGSNGDNYDQLFANAPVYTAAQ